MTRNLLEMTNESATVGYYSYNNYDDFITSNVGDFGDVFIPTLYSIVFIVGLIGNGFVLCVLVKYRQRSNMTDVCLFNLALCDLLFLISLPFWAYYAANQWIFGSFMCHAVTAFYMLGFYGSIFFMMLMTVDRYIVIVQAHTSLFFKRQSVKVGIALVLFMWTLSLGASLPNIIFSQEQNESNELTCQPVYPYGTRWREVSYIQLNILGLILPIFVMGFCYSQIIPILVTMKSQKKNKAIKLILTVIIAFFLCWIPYNVVVFLKCLVYLHVLDGYKWWTDLGMAMHWAEGIAFSHCCVNPIIYAFMGQRFRTLVIRTLKEWFPICFSRCKTMSSELTEKRSTMCSSVTSNTTFV